MGEWGGRREVTGVTSALPPPGWYPDPAGGGVRYWDGLAWTYHVAAMPMSPTVPAERWKGEKLGLPEHGPGALAAPSRRLGAQALDLLLLLPLTGTSFVVTLALVLPHVGPLFPNFGSSSTTGFTIPGFVKVEFTVLALVVVDLVLMAIYQTVTTATMGRSFGKRWCRIRPVRTTLEPLNWWQSFARASIYALSWVLNCIGFWVGLLDPLWCLWDAERQCLHDKAVDSLVINDPLAEGAEPAAQPASNSSS